MTPEAPSAGWLELVRWFVSSPYPLTAFLLIVVLLAGYIAYLTTRHFIKKHEALSAAKDNRHKLCEWRIQNVINAMIYYVRENGKDPVDEAEASATSSGNRSNHGRRKSDELVGRMLQNALAGPVNDAQRAEVQAIQL